MGVINYMNLKKTIISILSLLCLVGCGSNSSRKNDSQSTSQYNNDESQINESGNNELKINADNFWQHFEYQVTKKNNYNTDYSTYKSYTTIISCEIKQLRQGFVTYSGSATILLVIGWSDSSNQHKTKSIEIPMVAYDYSTKFSYDKSFNLSTDYYDSQKPEDIIPYSTNYSVDSISIRNCQITATYYTNGISGDDELSVKSYKITIANYSVYLTMGSDLGKSYIYPLATSELYDYRITMNIEGKKYILRRDGRYYFDILFENPLITSVDGYIDVYPGRVI